MRTALDVGGVSHGPHSIEIQNRGRVCDIHTIQHVCKTLGSVRSLREDPDPIRVEPPLHNGGDVSDLCECLEPSRDDNSKVGEVSVHSAPCVGAMSFQEVRDFIVDQLLQLRIETVSLRALHPPGHEGDEEWIYYLTRGYRCEVLLVVMSVQTDVHPILPVWVVLTVGALCLPAPNKVQSECWGPARPEHDVL